MKQRCLVGLLVTVLGSLAGCSGGSDSAAPAAAATSGTVPASQRPAQLRVTDITGRPIAGAVITVTAREAIGVTTTGDDGVAPMSDMPTGQVTLSVSAAGFDPVTDYRTRLPGGVTGLSLAK